MTLLRRPRRELPAALLLLVLPLLAHMPAWGLGRLLAPGDGAALHFPLRAAVWESFRRGEVPGWNPAVFLGTPLLGAYRHGAFYPPMAALSLLGDFLAFQVLVLASLSAAGLLTYLYLRRLGVLPIGAYLAGLSFSLGPYLVGHLGDTATIVAAPLLPLLMLAAESHVNRASPARAAGVSAALALLLLAGSPEAARAGMALLVGRLVVGHTLRHPRAPSVRASVFAVAVGVLLAAPQLLPALLTAREAGRAVTGLAAETTPLPGLFGLVLRYASHTPAPALAVAALPLVLTRVPVRVLGLALLLSLLLQWGRGPLAAGGTLALVFDFTLAVLGGLSLSAQWRERLTPAGVRLRAYFLVASLASAAALSVAAAALGPLPQSLSGPVGVLALSLILFFSLATSKDPVIAGAFLIPLTVSFLLQPYGRGAWGAAPTEAALREGSATWQALGRVMSTVPDSRALSLVREWPRGAESDLGYGNLAGLRGLRSANGYDPQTPLRLRVALGGMSVGGILPGAFFRTDPARLEALGIRWVTVPRASLAMAEEGDRIDLVMAPGERRFFPLPIGSATAVRVVSSGQGVGSEGVVAVVRPRLASTGRTFELALRAGEQVLDLPGRYLVDGVEVDRTALPGRLGLQGLAIVDAGTTGVGRVSTTAAYLSDPRLVERVATPSVRLYEVPRAAPARVVRALRLMPGEDGVLAALAEPRRFQLDLREEALATGEDAAGIAIPPGARSGRAETHRPAPGRIDVHAEGPGLLVVAEGWERGWRASVDGTPARLLRVNQALMGVVLPPGAHRVALRHRVRGLAAGLGLAGLGGILGALALRGGIGRERRRFPRV